tara:strand:- start:316 stop:723 length:408 start_codon:yes stop_codon:yes gene_type:complete
MNDLEKDKNADFDHSFSIGKNPSVPKDIRDSGKFDRFFNMISRINESEHLFTFSSKFNQDIMAALLLKDNNVQFIIYSSKDCSIKHFAFVVLKNVLNNEIEYHLKNNGFYFDEYDLSHYVFLLINGNRKENYGHF